MLKKLVLAMVFLCLALNVSGQFYKRIQLDSLQNAFAAQSGLQQLNTLLILTETQVYFQLDSARAYADLAKNKALYYKNTWAYMKAVYCDALISFQFDNFSVTAKKIKSAYDWFDTNGYERDALLSKIFYDKCLLLTFGNTRVRPEIENVHKRAENLEDNRVLGLSWFNMCMSKPKLLNNTQFIGSFDSAMYYSNLAKDSSAVLVAYQFKYFGQGPQSLDVSKSAFQRATAWGNKKAYTNAARILGYMYAFGANIDEVNDYRDKIIAINKRYSSYSIDHYGWRMKGIAYLKLDSNDRLIASMYEGLEVIKKTGNKLQYPVVYRSLAMGFNRKGEYASALESLFLGLYWAEELQIEYEKSAIKKMIADTYTKTQDFDKAELEYIELINWAETLLEGEAKSKYKGNIYLQLGDNLTEQGDYLEAKSKYEIAYKELNGIYGYDVRADIGLFTNYLDLDLLSKADSTLHKIKLDHKDLLERMNSFAYLEGRYYVKSEQYSKAIERLEFYLDKTQLSMGDRGLLDAYYQLYLAYEALGRDKEALNAFKKYREIEEALNEGEIRDDVVKIRSEYEIAARETEIDNLKQKQELADLRLERQNSQLELRQLYIILLVAGFLSLSLITYILFRQYKQKKEEEAQKAQLELENENFEMRQKAELAEVKNTIFANISHEFRTPLTLIQVPLKSYMQKVPYEDQSIFKGVLKSTTQLLTMVNELLELSKMESGDVKLNLSDFNLSNFFSEVKRDFVPLFETKHLQAKWEIDVKSAAFFGDKNRLKIVINNILKNAYSNTPNQGEVRVTLNRVNEDGLELKIYNTGEPIANKDLPFVFDRYFRADEEKYAGTGIGLALSKQIVEMHGGTIKVRNIKQKGVEFKCFFPFRLRLIDEQNSTIEKSNNPESDQYDLVSSNEELKPKILVVEYNLEMRVLIA